MIRRSVVRVCRVRSLLLGGLLALAVTQVWAALPGPANSDAEVARTVVALLETRHLNNRPLDDGISAEFFRTFLEDFDPYKLYFERQDIEEFKPHQTTLDDEVKRGDLSFAYQVYERLLQRGRQRLELIKELIELPHDFTVDEYLSTDYKNIDYAATSEEIRERWRKRIKYELLLQRVAKKPLPEAEQKAKVLRRYQSLLHRWEQIDSDEMLERFLGALTTCYDPHTSYMSPSTLEDFTISMSLHLDGIGARLRFEDGYTVVDAIIPGGAAARDGRLKVGDKIVGVDPNGTGENVVDVVDMKLTKVVKLIRGPRNTKVLLRVIPAGSGAQTDYVITRAKIELKSSEARGVIIEHGKKPDGQPYRIGYINLPSFYLDIAAANSGQRNFRSSTRDVRRLLEQFQNTEGGIDGLILDLRHNGGGALTEAISMTGLFISRGPVVQVRSGSRIESHQDRDGGQVAYTGPLLVLVSRLSASASEIFAGAIKDYQRGLIVGDPATHGKGTVQTMVELGRQFRLPLRRPGGLGALKLTIQQFFRVNGDSTQNRGVPSDIKLPSVVAHMEIGEQHLPHALPFARIEPVGHQKLGWVKPEVVKTLQANSEKRRQQSDQFRKLEQDIARFEQRQRRKAVPLNEAKLRAEIKQRDEAKKELQGPFDMPDPNDPVFKHNFYNDEVLAIMADYLEMLRPRLESRQAQHSPIDQPRPGRRQL